MTCPSHHVPALVKDLFTKFDITKHLNPKVLTGLATVGAFHLVYQYLTTPVVGLWRHLLRPRKNLIKRYGSNWAVVTGASDGIGEAYCYELAKQGFNIILISRTMDKLEKVAAKLRDDYKVQTKIIQFDFGTLSNPERVKELYEKLDTIQEDVCLLANNAGLAAQAQVHAHTVEQVFNMVNVNINAVVFVGRYFLAKFKERQEKHGQRSCVINIASIGGKRPYENNSVYCGTKAFDRLFSLVMQKEYAAYVDVLTVLPMSTKTGLNPGLFLGTINADQHAKSVVKSIGYQETETYGHWIHGIQNNLYNFTPTAYLIGYINYRRVLAFKKKLAEAAAAK